MVAKREIKFIKSLRQKKYRSRHGLFLAEGVKLVTELLKEGWKPQHLYSTDPGFLEHKAELITDSELQHLSTLVQPNKVLGVFEIPAPEPPEYSGWLLALDGVRDPGNLGTIIRLCDWFGIRDLLCSPDTVDCYNPKVLMATMGSIARVRVHYLPLESALLQSELPVYIASMEGKSVTAEELRGEGILVMGSESHGISGEIRALPNTVLSVPPYGNGRAESLNVGTATGIMLYEIRRAAKPATQR